MNTPHETEALITEMVEALKTVLPLLAAFNGGPWIAATVKVNAALAKAGGVKNAAVD